MKVLERIIDARIQQMIGVPDTQYGFMSGKIMIDATWVVKTQDSFKKRW